MSVRVIDVQHEKFCSVHAINNALQKKVIQCAQARKALVDYYTNLNAIRKAKGKPPLDREAFFYDNYERSGFSLSLFDSILKSKHLMMQTVHGTPSIPKLQSGIFVVSGEYPSFKHSIGIHKGYIIESLNVEKPITRIVGSRIPWPENFRPLAFYEIVPYQSSRHEKDIIELD